MPPRKADQIDPAEWPDEHPLFPVEEGAQPPNVKFIHVTRFEKGGQVFAERVYKADELTDLSQIAQQYGGGQYELIGRSPAKKNPDNMGNISARRRYRIAGKSLPIAEAPDDDDEKPAYAPPASGLTGDSAFIIALMQMNQQNQQAAEQRAEAQAARDAENNRQFMQLMMQQMTAGKAESAQMTTLLLQMSQQQQASTMQMMTTMLTARGGGPEELAKYAELLKTLQGKGGEANEGEDSASIPNLIENIADIVTGAPQLLSQLKPGQGPPVNAPPGSAASVLAGGGGGGG